MRKSSNLGLKLVAAISVKFCDVIVCFIGLDLFNFIFVSHQNVSVGNVLLP